MLALGIRYLNGFVAACDPDARHLPEWPPHPARVFMALAAAHFQTGVDPQEREVLIWLEQLPPPGICASAVWPRMAVTHYVPVNDKPGDRSEPPKAIIQAVPQLARDRQPRTFARAWIEEEMAYLVWPDATPEADRRRALASLCAKVTRIGHSTSLVQMWVARPDEVREVNWVPDDARGEIYLRVPGPGTLDDLERRYNASEVESYASLLAASEDDQDKKTQREAKRVLKERFGGAPPVRLRPQLSRYQGYARPLSRKEQGKVAATVFSPHMAVFGFERRSGPFVALGLASVLAITQRWREALVSHSNDMPDTVREIVSGHDGAGKPLERPHLAFVPMAFVGHPHADGHLLGMAAALPSNLDAGDRRKVLQVLGRVHQLKLGALGVWDLVRETGDWPPASLRPEVWSAYPAGERHWATVTPVAFDRHPKQKDPRTYHREVAAMIAAACTAVGLPQPREVIVTSVSAHLGVAPAHAFPRLPRKEGGDRRHTHAILVFDEPVLGPILIGAGRYRGYGVCRPMNHRSLQS